jgi:hypothetical protein
MLHPFSGLLSIEIKFALLWCVYTVSSWVGYCSLRVASEHKVTLLTRSRAHPILKPCATAVELHCRIFAHASSVMSLSCFTIDEQWVNSWIDLAMLASCWKASISGLVLSSGQKLTLGLLATITIEVAHFRTCASFPVLLPFLNTSMDSCSVRVLSTACDSASIISIV